MLRAGTALRFTPAEVEEFRSLGLDFDGARTQADVEQALTAWAQLLSDERPDLLERIVVEMAQAKGVKTPPKLALAASVDAACGFPRPS
jgi:cytochrome c-type biogenesis protein CcmH/NrfG